MPAACGAQCGSLRFVRVSLFLFSINNSPPSFRPSASKSPSKPKASTTDRRYDPCVKPVVLVLIRLLILIRFAGMPLPMFPDPRTQLRHPSPYRPRYHHHPSSPSQARASPRVLSLKAPLRREVSILAPSLLLHPPPPSSLRMLSARLATVARAIRPHPLHQPCASQATPGPPLQHTRASSFSTQTAASLSLKHTTHRPTTSTLTLRFPGRPSSLWRCDASCS